MMAHYLGYRFSSKQGDISSIEFLNRLIIRSKVTNQDTDSVFVT